jgi:hypothetical protein
MTKSPSKKSQRGVVLVVSLVFLVALTAVAAALMQNSTSDMKMSGASEEKAVALQEVVSAVDEVIFNQVAPGKTNLFSRPITGEDNFPVTDQSVLLPETKTKSKARIAVANTNVTCPRMLIASSDGRFFCNTLTLTAKRYYGRTQKSAITASAGITQVLIGSN